MRVDLKGWASPLAAAETTSVIAHQGSSNKLNANFESRRTISVRLFDTGVCDYALGQLVSETFLGTGSVVEHVVTWQCCVQALTWGHAAAHCLGGGASYAAHQGLLW
jgi:hypothetical protein